MGPRPPSQRLRLGTAPSCGSATSTRSEDLFFPLNVLQRLCAMEAGVDADQKHAGQDTIEMRTFKKDDPAPE